MNFNVFAEVANNLGVNRIRLLEISMCLGIVMSLTWVNNCDVDVASCSRSTIRSSHPPLLSHTTNVDAAR